MQHNLLDSTFNGMGGSTMYRSWVFPELYPNERPARLENWCQDDLEMSVGGCFTPGYGERRAA